MSQVLKELLQNHRSGWSLDQRFYSDPNIFALEMKHIVGRHWILAGHVSQIPEPGDWMVFNLASESAIILRDSHGEVRCFANVCRHRGSRICLEARGNSRKLSCPYHAWIYELDGTLAAARSMPEGFDKSEFGLLPVSVETLFGFVFVCFSDDPPSMEAARKGLAKPSATFDLENLKVAAEKTYPIAANWKLAVENYMECYHCAPAHPDYAKMHTLMVDRRLRDRLQKKMRDRMEGCGIRDLDIDCSAESTKEGSLGFSYSRTAMFEGYLTGSRDGKPIAPLLGRISDYDGGASDFSFGELSFLLAYSDHVVAYVFTPVDQQRSQCKIYWLVRSDAIEGKDYEKDELMWLWDVTTHADEKIIVDNQAGVNSSHYRPGPLSEMERNERRFIDWVVDSLSDAIGD
jgi:Rieske 2Fe-2S family protein